MTKVQKNYRLGIDLGSTSLGWCMLELDQNKEPIGIINMGVRIFPDGRDAKTHEPLSVSRRGYRGQRRNLDRYLLRIRTLITYLMEHGFLPEDERSRNEVFKINPYYLRSRALDEALAPAEFARALIHLAKRRGFKSNRKILSDKTTKISEAIDNLKQALKDESARTLGDYMWNLYQELPQGKEHLRKPIKFRYENNPEYANPIFPTREMVEQEFDAIWEAQSSFNILLNTEHKQAIREIIFNQRPLKPQPKGKCQLLPEYNRAPKAHPLFQEFRIRQDLNNMKAIELFDNETVELTTEQYEALYRLLSTKNEVTFASMRKELWGKKANDYRFNLETNERTKLLGDQTYAVFHKKENATLTQHWDAWSLELKNRVIEIIISDLDDEPALLELREAGIQYQEAIQLLDVNLPDSYCHLSAQAMQKILPFMRQRRMYSDACKEAKLDHSGEYNGEVFTEGDLPYYGEVLSRETIALSRKSGDDEADAHGKINNPTVHIALNQLRKVVNALCQRYGAPQEIVLELGKDIKLGKAEKEKLNKQMYKNRIENEKIEEFLRSHDLPINHLNKLKTKLWWELGADVLDRRCIYSGHQISATDLYTRKIEVDHILPKSRTYDDGNANKILCISSANKYKAERSPYEAFGGSRDGYNWQDILTRAKNLKSSKQWRFQTDAMDMFSNQEELLARMLNDTRYMSRAAMKYMYYICGASRVWTITGKHTGMLRGKWGLNTALGETDAKERSDHRHHAIDAFVIALTTRGMIKSLANNISQSRDRFIEDLDPPWKGFDHTEFRNKVNALMVSYKPDQIDAVKLGKRCQTGGALAEETAYSCVGVDPENPKYHLYAVRKGITDITDKNYEQVAAPEFREELAGIAEVYKGTEFKQKVKEWAAHRNIKKVKLVSSMNPDSMIPVKDKDGRAFKYMSSGENLFADIFIKDPTDHNCKWSIEIVNSYNAHQPGFVPKWKKEHPKAKKIMRVFKNDIIALDGPDGKRELRRVRKMTKGIFFLRKVNIAKKPKGQEDIGEQYSPNQLKEYKACKAGVDIIGRWFDPIVNENDQRS